MKIETDNICTKPLGGKLAGCEVSVSFSGTGNKDAIDEAIGLLLAAFTRSHSGPNDYENN